MALLLAIFMAQGLIVGGSIIALLLAIFPSTRPEALKWFSLLAGTGFLGAAATFGLVYLWEKILNLGGVSDEISFAMLVLPALSIFIAQMYFFYGRKKSDNQAEVATP